MDNNLKRQRIKEAKESAKGVSLLELGYSNYKLCKIIPKIYHPFSFIMAVAGVVSAAALYLKANDSVSSWLVAVSSSILAVIIFFFLESWKKAYTPEYFRRYFKNEYIPTTYTAKLTLAYTTSLASTIFGVWLMSTLAQDNSAEIESQYAAKVAAVESRVQLDTASINSAVIEYKLSNQIHINSTKTVLNPKASSGLQLLLESKKNTVESARLELQQLKRDKDQDKSKMFDSSGDHSNATATIFLVFELLVLGSIAYVVDRDVQIVEEYTEQEEEPEVEEEEGTVLEKETRVTPSYERKYPNVVSMIREGLKDIDIMKESGVAKTTFYRIKKEVA